MTNLNEKNRQKVLIMDSRFAETMMPIKEVVKLKKALSATSTYFKIITFLNNQEGDETHLSLLDCRRLSELSNSLLSLGTMLREIIPDDAR